MNFSHFWVDHWLDGDKLLLENKRNVHNVGPLTKVWSVLHSNSIFMSKFLSRKRISVSPSLYISFSPQPFKADGCPPESVSAWGFFSLGSFPLPLSLHTWSAGIGCFPKVFWDALDSIQRFINKGWLIENLHSHPFLFWGSKEAHSFFFNFFFKTVYCKKRYC